MSVQPPPPGQPDYGSHPQPPEQLTYQPPAYPPPPPSYEAPPTYEVPPTYEAPNYQAAPPQPSAYQPPPPQPSAYQPPPPGYASAPGYGQPAYAGAPAAKSGLSFNPASVDWMDWAILGVAFLTFICSFFSYYTASYRGIGSGSESAWHGFFGWFAVLVALASAGLIALELIVPQIKLPVPIRLASLIGWALATLSVLLALVVFPEDVPNVAGLSTGRGFGYWADLVLIIAGVVLSVLRLKATGGKLPWEQGPSGHSGSTTHPGYTAPAPNYQPPIMQQMPPNYQPPQGGYPQQ